MEKVWKMVINKLKPSNQVFQVRLLRSKDKRTQRFCSLIYPLLHC